MARYTIIPLALALVGVAEATYVRLCMLVVPQHETHTILHHLTFHKLMGVDDTFIYVDDHGMDPNTLAQFTSLVTTVPGVRVHPFSKSTFEVDGKSLTITNEPTALYHCQRDGHEDRSKAGFPRDQWIMQFDADEYIAPGPAIHHRPLQRPMDFPLKAWLDALPQAQDGVLVPRRDVVGGSEVAGPIQRPPTDIFGSHFFEGRVYTSLKNSTDHLMTACDFGKNAKWIARMAPADIAGLRSGSSRGLRSDVFPKEAVLYSNRRSKPPCPLMALGKRDWLVDYTSIILFHFSRRSVEECTTKIQSRVADHLASGFDADVNAEGAQGQVADSSDCSSDDWRKYPTVWNIWQYADAVDEKVCKLQQANGGGLLLRGCANGTRTMRH